MNKKSSFAAPLLALAMAGALPATAQAQSMSSGWQFEAAIYGWFPGIDGNIAYPDGGGRTSTSASAT